jgi:hypothetical protein
MSNVTGIRCEGVAPQGASPVWASRQVPGLYLCPKLLRQACGTECMSTGFNGHSVDEQSLADDTLEVAEGPGMVARVPLGGRISGAGSGGSFMGRAANSVSEGT